MPSPQQPKEWSRTGTETGKKTKTRQNQEDGPQHNTEEKNGCEGVLASLLAF